MKFKLIVFTFVISVLLVACGGTDTPSSVDSSDSDVTLNPTDTPVTSTESDEDEQSDMAVSPLAGPSSPLNAPSSPLNIPVPAPEPTAIPIVQFRLDGPLYGEMEEVSGFGPANLPVIIVDISGGEKEILAEVVTDDDGNFTTDLNRPLKAGFRIGVTIGNLEDSDLTFEDFLDRGFYGLDAMSFPQFGFFYDTKMTLEKE